MSDFTIILPSSSSDNLMPTGITKQKTAQLTEMREANNNFELLIIEPFMMTCEDYDHFNNTNDTSTEVSENITNIIENIFQETKSESDKVIPAINTNPEFVESNDKQSIILIEALQKPLENSRDLEYARISKEIKSLTIEPMMQTNHHTTPINENQQHKAQLFNFSATKAIEGIGTIAKIQIELGETEQGNNKTNLQNISLLQEQKQTTMETMLKNNLNGSTFSQKDRTPVFDLKSQNAALHQAEQTVKSFTVEPTQKTVTPQLQQLKLNNVVKQVSSQLSQALERGNTDRIEIQLQPRTMGRVTIQMEIKEGQLIQMNVQSSQQQTLDLLSQGSNNLAELLSDAGLETNSNQMNFTLTQDDHSASELNSGISEADIVEETTAEFTEEIPDPTKLVDQRV